jgi:hypothetical protein
VGAAQAARRGATPSPGGHARRGPWSVLLVLAEEPLELLLVVLQLVLAVLLELVELVTAPLLEALELLAGAAHEVL